MTLNAVNERPRIGSIGTGVLGASICSHLMNVGSQMAVHTRTREKAAPLEAGGGRKGTQALLLALAKPSEVDWDGDTEIT